jgi:hypothetical protein
MGDLFSPPPPPPVPVPKPPAPMPDPESPEVREARRRATLEALARSGRKSTILTDASDRGSTEYTRTKLG